ncbi:MAG TPA: hypothetical protein VNJ12_09840 [Candidatus Dormibacteraeota bacterium]|nr:hypothetical protein [Candidatus Dormibacteraeota bacterium]
MSAATQIQLVPPKTIQIDATEAIVAETARACQRRYSPALRALVVTGSLARGEATALAGNGAIHILGDAEFLLIFRRRSMLPASAELRDLESEISRSLIEKGVACPVHLAGVTRHYLRRLPAHIFSYELRTAGKVAMGDEKILSAIPRFRSSQIKREDAWRLLSNRMIEWLEALAATSPDRQRPDIGLFYASVKLWLDAATSLLVFLRKYKPSYQARAERLSTLAENVWRGAPVPFPLRELSLGVDAATSWKFFPDKAAMERMGWAFCDQARRMAGMLWCWEAAQLTGFDAASAPLTQLQSCRLKTWPWRGWLRTARECRWQGLQQPWRHWLALSRWGSPRQCVYALAAECMLRSDDFGPWAKDGLASQLRAARLRRFLPVPDPPLEEYDDGWRQLARELAWNYHALVEKTRA